MKKYTYLLGCIILSACSAKGTIDIRARVTPSHAVNPEVARQIVLQWMLMYGAHNSAEGFSVERVSEWESKECSARGGALCDADYLIYVVPPPKCASEFYPVVEKCDQKICSYEIGGKIEELTCW